MSILNISKYLSDLNRARLEKRRSRRAKPGCSKISGQASKALLSGTEINTFSEAVKYDAPSPEFEEKISEIPPANVLAKLICFYLPQFHAIDENDRWWGKGFTEWRNVARAMPRFPGHYQPRVPRDLGFYDLNHVDTMRQQVKLARAAGITGFSFYYYNFDGRRILEKPLEAFLENSDIDIEFCITWANENWTRRWDGLDQDVLLEQTYSAEYEGMFAKDVCRHFADPRYIRIDGRPLFIIYRPGIIPEFSKWLDCFKRHCLEGFNENPYILMVQGFGTIDPNKFGLDGALEFPPHKLLDGLRPVQHKQVFDPNFSGIYFDYDDLVKSGCTQPPSDFDVVKCVAPNWDNEARKPGRGMGFVNSLPSKYENWLARAVGMAREKPLAGKHPFVFINAWNEWAEGTYLEPDIHFGHAYLNATRRAVTGATLARGAASVLLVGHDAHPHGAQLLLLHIARVLTESLGCKVAICLLEGGPLLRTYIGVAPTFVISQSDHDWQDKLLGKASAALGKDFGAICNTIVSGNVVPVLKDKGIPVISLIHELPNLIRERGLHSEGKKIAKNANSVVFPSALVRDAFCAEVDRPALDAVIRPQGIYQDLDKPRRARRVVCSSLGIPTDAKIVINVGYGDLRKGLDLFIKIAELVTATREDVYFVWVGKKDQALWQWLKADVPAAPARQRIIMAGYQESPLDYIEAADVFALTSREDPFPSVVMESLGLGVPVVAYKGSGGHCELLTNGQNGALAEAFRVDSFATAVLDLLDAETAEKRLERISHNRTKFDFKSYVFDLLKYLQPAIRKVSVIVTCYNQRAYIHERLSSIFTQNYPIHEIIVVDDASTDGTADEVENIAKEFNRNIKLVRCPSNSGSAFGNWKSAVKQASGDLIWIAEGDDSADPNFLRRLTAVMGEDHIFSFADSRQIDSAGKVLGESYDFYLKLIDPAYFKRGGEVAAQDFLQRFLSVRNCILNISSVLFQRTALLDVLQALHGDIMNFRLAGDWRLYAALLVRAKGKVSYLSASLNVHRRHENAGVTSSLDRTKHLQEVQRMHQLILDVLPAQAREQTRQQQQVYQAELAKMFDIELREPLTITDQ
jgi:glycosyltransferase involved in cell wall biosynthesis